MQTNEKIRTKKDKLFDNLTDPYVLIFLMILCAALATYIVPAGQYERYKDEASGRTLINPEEFSYIENTPVGITDIFMSIPTGYSRQATITFFVLLLGGAFEVMNKSGFTNSFVAVAIKKFEGKDKLLFAMILIVFGGLGATINFANGIIAFIPIVVLMCKALGYDALVAMTLVFVGNRAGHINGMMNVITMPIAQGIAGVPIFSGIEYRTPWFIITLILSFFVMMRYANRIKKDPTKSLLYNESMTAKEADRAILDNAVFTGTHKIIGIVLTVTLVFIIYGSSELGIGIAEMGAIFAAFGIAVGIIARMEPVVIVNGFLDGMKKMIPGIMIVGISTSIVVVLEQGQIIDTIVMSCAGLISQLPKVLIADGMFAFQWLLNILIPSGSGQAAVTMPLMIPLADVLDINRQVAVTAFHYGDGITNLITPANGPLMAALGIAGIPYAKWMKYIVPMLIVWTLIGFASVTVAQMINLGPI